MWSFHFQSTNLSDIQGLKPKSSVGYDHLSSKVLKDIASIKLTPWSKMINRSLCSGTFPSKLKIANMISLFRKGDIQLFGNNRPIFLLSSVLKIFEKAAYSQPEEYFSSHALFMIVSTDFENFTKLNLTEFTKKWMITKFHFISSLICQKPWHPWSITINCYINYNIMEFQAQPLIGSEVIWLNVINMSTTMVLHLAQNY